MGTTKSITEKIDRLGQLNEEMEAMQGEFGLLSREILAYMEKEKGVVEMTGQEFSVKLTPRTSTKLSPEKLATLLKTKAKILACSSFQKNKLQDYLTATQIESCVQSRSTSTYLSKPKRIKKPSQTNQSSTKRKVLL